MPTSTLLLSFCGTNPSAVPFVFVLCRFLPAGTVTGAARARTAAGTRTGIGRGTRTGDGTPRIAGTEIGTGIGIGIRIAAAARTRTGTGSASGLGQDRDQDLDHHLATGIGIGTGGAPRTGRRANGDAQKVLAIPNRLAEQSSRSDYVLRPSLHPSGCLRTVRWSHHSPWPLRARRRCCWWFGTGKFGGSPTGEDSYLGVAVPVARFCVRWCWYWRLLASQHKLSGGHHPRGRCNVTRTGLNTLCRPAERGHPMTCRSRV